MTWTSGIETIFMAAGDVAAPISIKIIGTKGCKDMIFSDVFSAFKKALNAFITGVHEKSIQSSKTFNYRVVDIIQAGCK